MYCVGFIMKKKIVVLFLLFQFSFIYAEDNLEDINNIFNSANELYNQGKYLEANNLYLNLVSSNIVSKDLYYNLASSYYEMGSNGYAVLWFEKALNIAPFDKDIKNNILKITEAKNYDSIYIIIFYFVLFLFLILFSSLFISFIKKRKLSYLFLAVSIVFLAVSIFFYNKINSNYIIVIKDTNIYKGSSIKSDIVSSVYEGEKFRVIKESSDWYYVKGISKGWVNKEYIERI